MASHRIFTVFLIIVLAAMVAACNGDGGTPAAAQPTPAEPAAGAQPASPLLAPQSPLPVPAVAVTPESGKAAISGRLISLSTSEPMVNQNLSLPAMLCAPGVAEADKREQCFYMIDEAFDPSALTDGDGRFVFQNIPAGEYVMLVGNLMTEYTILSDELDRPMIWKADANQVLELGDLLVDLQ